jgi:murein L,D-transpeptidase YcbB/YkuD
MKHLPLFVAASLATLIAAGASRAQDAAPAAADLAAVLPHPVVPPEATPEIVPEDAAPATTGALIDPARPAVAPLPSAAEPVVVPPAPEPVPVAAPADKPAVEPPLVPAAAAPVTEPPAPEPLPIAAPADTPAAEPPLVAPAAAPVTAPPAPEPLPVAAPAVEPPLMVPAPAAVPAVDPMRELQAEADAEARAALVAELGRAVEAMDLKAGTADERRDRAAVQAFYRARQDAPLFFDGRDIDAVGRSVMTAFAKADEDGLDPAAYAVEPPAIGAPPEVLATAELAFAETALAYARHASGGRLVLSRISPLVTPKIELPDPAQVLARLATAPDAGQALIAYNPPHEGYKRLKAKLAALRLAPPAAAPAQVIVPDGPSLKPGTKDVRILALRKRLNVPAAEGADAEVYDDVLVAQVRLYQKERGLGTDGLVGPATLATLNKAETPRVATAADIIVNMERWRWLPRNLGSLNVFVNIAGFYLDINRDGHSIHRTRVIVGRAQNQTPIFSQAMNHIIVNPYWNVPVSILKKEMLDDIQATGGASLDRGNYEVLVNDRVVASNAVDWSNVDASQVRVRQRPGAGNALGNVKFMFPNQHSVYLHDTSSRNLFSQDARSLSHGCVRVFEPFTFANKLLASEPDGLSGDKLQAMVGGPEKTIWLKVKPMVHLTYFTTVVEDDGTLTVRRDLYGHDQRMKQLLGL